MTKNRILCLALMLAAAGCLPARGDTLYVLVNGADASSEIFSMSSTASTRTMAHAMCSLKNQINGHHRKHLAK